MNTLALDAMRLEIHVPRTLIVVTNDAMASMGLVGMGMLAFVLKQRNANKLKLTLASRFNTFPNFLIHKIIKVDLLYISINAINNEFNKQIR